RSGRDAVGFGTGRAGVARAGRGRAGRGDGVRRVMGTDHGTRGRHAATAVESAAVSPMRVPQALHAAAYGAAARRVASRPRSTGGPQILAGHASIASRRPWLGEDARDGLGDELVRAWTVVRAVEPAVELCRAERV